MSTLTLPQLELFISQLSFAEQLWLIERMIHRMRETAAKRGFDAQLATMAADPQIQAELQQIDAEFAQTTADGLDGV